MASVRARLRNTPSSGMAQSRCHLDVRTIGRVAGDMLHFASSMLRSRAQVAAENLFLRNLAAPA